MFRFTIRDVLWLTLVVALAVAWRVDHSQYTPQERELLKQLKEMGFDFQQIMPTTTAAPSPTAIPQPTPNGS